MYRGFTPQMYILRAVSQDWRPVLLPAVALPLRFRDRNDMIMQPHYEYPEKLLSTRSDIHSR
jgi:hypothetical protein